MRDTRPLLLQTDFPPIGRSDLTTLQLNLGYTCNLSCVHCHVNAGPSRTEQMSLEVIDLVLAFVDKHNIQSLDLTGGAPEMNQHFRYLVTQCRFRNVEIIDRCNLTIIEEPGYEWLAEFLADNGVTITASLPCYEEANVTAQRGGGVYATSIRVLQQLNKLGYGREPAKQLNLVYNPVGAVLPPPQASLQADYKRELFEQYSISFDQLFTITNQPISRFGSVLLAHNQFDQYMGLLKSNYATENLDGVMCRNLLSIDWQGYAYDCDFNQMLDLPLQGHGSLIAKDGRLHLKELLESTFCGAPIVVGEHCYACTAGQGSSCGGAL